MIGFLLPGLSLALQPWAEISERLRRIFKLNHYWTRVGICPFAEACPIMSDFSMTI